MAIGIGVSPVGCCSAFLLASQRGLRYNQRSPQEEISMCAVSAIGDNFRDSFPGRWPNFQIPPALPGAVPGALGGVSRLEFEALKREVQELRALLLAAKKFDEATGQTECEIDDKVAFIKWLADFVGVDMKDVFK